MTPTSLVDHLDPPVRTLAEIEQDEHCRIERMREAWSVGGSRLTGSNSARSAPVATSLERALRTCDGSKRRAAMLFGTSESTFNLWLRQRGLSQKWTKPRGQTVYSDRGESWPGVEEARQALGVSFACITYSIREASVMRKGGRMLDWHPFPGVTYAEAK